MDELKTQSTESFDFANRAKASVVDVEELRSTIAESLGGTFNSAMRCWVLDRVRSHTASSRRTWRIY